MISIQDRNILRRLARRVAELAGEETDSNKIEQWRRHNSLKAGRPIIYISPEGSWPELIPPEVMECEGENARHMEYELRMRIYHVEYLEDDHPVENEWLVPKVIRSSGWGLQPKQIPSTTTRGAWHFDPVLHGYEEVKKLRLPQLEYDEAQSRKNLAETQDLFGDILNVQLTGVKHISYHLMQQYTYLRGLEEMMVDMIAEPQFLHDVMQIFTAGHRAWLEQLEHHNLLSLNNDKTYHNSGGTGYLCGELPAEGFDPEHVRPCDMWGSAESQELAQVSPEHHAEFSLTYEKQLLEPFGLTGYGCCEDLTRKLDDVFTIPHIRRISISPWADVDVCAQRLGNRYIFSWKPQPAHLVGRFDEDLIRSYIRHTVETAQQNDCLLEIILKDTHTCESKPERFHRWSRIAREEVNRAYA